MRRSYSSWRVYCTICTLILIFTYSANSIHKYNLKCRKDVLQTSEQIMLFQVGIVETAHNRGIAEIYLSSVGLGAGYPYCAAGQYYCYLEAVKKLKLPQNLIPFTRTGLSRKILSDAAKKGSPAIFQPCRNDFIIWRVIGSSWQGHIERVISVGNAGWVTTAGFNVKLTDGKEGVAIKKRNIYHIIGKLKVAGIVGFEETEK
jgi:hypothetical protein